MDDGQGDVKKKQDIENQVAKTHHIYRNFMGSVDQGEVKAYILNLSRQKVQRWYRKQLLFCIETAVINSYCNYNLDPGCKAENFKE